MDNSKQDDNRTQLDIAHVDHTLLDIGLVSESDEAGINLDGFHLMAEIDPFSRRIADDNPILFREPPLRSRQAGLDR